MEKLPLTIFATGSFLEWQTGKRQAYTMLLNEMLSRKQVELLGGGYYQPYFPLLPASDVVGQIELMTAAVRTHFGKRPRGLFLTASAWTPSLVTPFTRCGMEYCLLDYRLFPTGEEPESPNKSYFPAVIEDNGKTITAFPYLSDDPDFLTRTPELFYEKVAATASERVESLYLLFLPVRVYVKCFERNKSGVSWMSSFIDLCSRSNSSVRLTHTAELMKRREPNEPVYIAPNIIFYDRPSGHSVKRTVTLHQDAFKIYAKMMYVNMLVNGMKGDKARKKYALQEFWKAQNAELFAIDPCLSEYHNELHRIAYRKLLVAEKQTRLPGVFTDGLTQYDIDMDGFKEFLSQRASLNMYVHLRGGKVFECDVFSAYKNYSDMPLGRSGMFIDYLLTETALQRLKESRIESLTPVFSNNTYQETEINAIRSELKLSTSGFFDAINQPVSLRKQYIFFAEGAQVQYILKNDSPFNLSAYFTVEIDIALEGTPDVPPSLSLYDCEENRKKECHITPEVFEKVSWIQLEDPDGKIQFTLEANEVPGLIIVPVYDTGSTQMSAVEQAVCGIRLFFYWKTDLNPNYETEKMLFLKVKNIKTPKSA